ncbi:hypothetical protein EDD18DRAFT_1275158 [Armillaria luteobubalina]|uniref:F-box domain-containing protein n=1 Tax=Armillaria luteobubalina TaxID=153913 RepID=A0AA39QPK3_9AGAR|nr:hypothetical protein EDD18DRAFT_1275158 [Armillaria luteobubalina]
MPQDTTCAECQFEAMHPYFPSVNPIELVRSGCSTFDISHISIVNDIIRLTRELRHIEPLFLKIRDRHDRILKDIACSKSLLAPIRRLPRETLLLIFGHLSSQNSDMREGPWILGHVCSTWRKISRSCPSLWTKIDISSKYGSSSFFNEFASLSGDLSIQLSVDYNSKYTLRRLRALLPHSQRWSSLDLNVRPANLSELLSLISLPLIHLSVVKISVSGAYSPPHHGRITDPNLFSSSPITDATFDDFPYLILPINVRMLQRFRACFYNPDEIGSIFRNASDLIEIVITMCPRPRPRDVEPALPIPYPSVSHTSLRQLSFVRTWENAEDVINVSQIFDYITLPTLKEFQILAWPRPIDDEFPRWLEHVEYSRIVNLLHRSGCDLTDLRFSIPVPVQSFLIPVLRQSPALEKFDVFIDTDTAGDVFRALTLPEGQVPKLRKLRIEDTPYAKCALLQEGDAFHAMVRSRLGGDTNSHLKTLRLSLTLLHPFGSLFPVAQDSPFRDLLKMKEEGLDVEFLFNMEECLVEGEASTVFFGSR